MKKRVGGHECLRDEDSEEICRKSLGADGEGAGQDVDHVKYKETAQGLQDSDMSLGLSISSAGCMDLHLPVASIQRDRVFNGHDLPTIEDTEKTRKPQADLAYQNPEDTEPAKPMAALEKHEQTWVHHNQPL